MTLAQLRYAICVADTHSMNEASRSLFISQPSLSTSIKELENEIGLELFKRTNRGVTVTPEGEEFLGYARQVVEQYQLVEDRYIEKKDVKKKFSVSMQHYTFAVKAFVEMVKQFGMDEYEFAVHETKTYEVIEDVRNFKSEIGILYLNDFNEPVLSKEIKSKELKFTELFSAKPHVFVGSANPLAQKKSVTLDDLLPYPYLSFEQGEYNSFYYSEEILSTIKRPKNIRVRDRATLFNLLIGLNGYTICSGVIDEKLNGSDIVAVPLEAEGSMRIGIVTHKKVLSNPLTEFYIKKKKKYIGEETRLTT